MEAEKLLTENIDKLHLVAEVLLELETLDGEQFEQLFTGDKTAEELIEDTKERERFIEANNAKEAAEHLAELAAEEEDEDEDEEDDDYDYEYELDDDIDEKDD